MQIANESLAHDGSARRREGLRIEIDTSLPAARAIRALDELVEVRGTLLSIRLNNGPEFIGHALAQWTQSKGIALNHIQPGKPIQHALCRTIQQNLPYGGAGLLRRRFAARSQADD